MDVDDQQISITSEIAITSTPTDEELEKLGSEIAKDWMKLGRRLHITDAKLQEIDQANEQLSEKGYHMLKHWQQSKGNAATYEALCTALQHQLVQRQDLVEKLLTFCYIKENKELRSELRIEQENNADLQRRLSTGNGQVQTELNRARIHSARIRRIVSDMTAVIEQRLETLEENVKSLPELLKEKDGNKVLKTKVQGIETTVKQLKALVEKSVKDVEVEEMEPLVNGRDQLDDSENMPIEPIRLMESEFEGNQTCWRCRQLEEKLVDINTVMGQLELKHNREKKDWEYETEKTKREAKLREANAKLSRLDPVRVNELEKENEFLRRQKDEIELQFRSHKERMEEELVSSKEMLEDLEKKRVKALRGKQRLKNENETFRKQIEDLKEKNKGLVTKNKDVLSRLKINEAGTSEFENLRAERDHLTSEIRQLRNEIDESQLKRRTLEDEIVRWRNAVSRIFLPSGKDFSSAAGVVSALKKDVSAKLAATRSSDGPGEAWDIIFHHKQGTESGTDERKDSWWCVDLGESYRLFITHCALRHGKKDGEAILQRWQLQGSTDGRMWTDLQTSRDPSDHTPFRAPYPYFTGRWTVEGKVGAFRYFRVLQTGRNSSGKYGIYLSGVELYGTLLHLKSCHNTLNYGNLK